jgi:hypothetical protein
MGRARSMHWGEEECIQVLVGGRKKVKLSLEQAMRHQGSQMVVRLSALHAGHPLPPGGFLVLISVRG